MSVVVELPLVGAGGEPIDFARNDRVAWRR
jgi:hypothetical protein